MKWFRFYPEWVNLIHLRRLTAEQKWAWIVLLCLGSESLEDEHLIILDDEDIAFAVEMTKQEWLLLKEILSRKKLIEIVQSGIRICDWEIIYPIPRARGSSEYRKHEAFVFKRDGSACVYCGATSSLTLDHVVPQSKGGVHEPENLVTCCQPCNSSKGAKDLGDWGGRL